MIAALLVFLIVFAMLYAVVAVFSDKRQNKALARKDELLAEMFQGEPETVSFTATMADLPANIVIEDAHRRGYRVIADSKTQHGPRELTFAKDS